MRFPTITFLLFLTSSSWANTVLAGQLDIKGVRLGMSQNDVKALEPEIFCAAYSTSESDTACYFKGLLTYAGTRAELFVLLKQDKVTTAWVTVDSADFENVVLAITEKLGEPSSKTTDRVQNLSGAKFDNYSFHWVRKGEILSARKYTEKITQSKISLSEFNPLDDLRKYKNRIKERSRDL